MAERAKRGYVLVRDKLLSLLREKSFEKRRVVLSSGKESDFYIDVKQTALHPEGAYLIGKLILGLLEKGERVEAVGGMTMGADPLSVSVSLLSYLDQQGKNRALPAFFVRKVPKKHGTEQWLEGTKNLKSGTAVAILEDVVTSGASTLNAIERAECGGLVVKRVIAVVDREEGGREEIERKGYVFESLFKRADFF